MAGGARRYLVPPVTTLLLLLWAPTARAVDACSYNSTSKFILVTSPGGRPQLYVANHYIYRIPTEGGVAVLCGDTYNTSTIYVTNTATNDRLDLQIYLSEPFEPGYGNETGSSDEIEFVLNFGTGGGALSLWALGATQRVSVVAGGNKLNLNAAESDGIDADVTINGTVKGDLEFQGGPFDGYLFDDYLDVNGGFGTPSTPFVRPVDADGGPGDDVMYGGPKKDRLVGGDDSDILEGRGRRDSLAGGPNGDLLLGGGGPDSIHAESGNDTLKGGGGNDYLAGSGDDDELFGNAGDDQCDGGKGHDSCKGGSGHDTFTRCEVKDQ